MIRLLIRVGLIILVLNYVFIPSAGLRTSNSRGSGKSDKGYKDPGRPKTQVGNSPGLPSQNATRRGLGISAWGIVIIVVAMVVAGMGFYYFSMCYPSFCHRQEKYQIMGKPTLA